MQSNAEETQDQDAAAVYQEGTDITATARQKVDCSLYPSHAGGQCTGLPPRLCMPHCTRQAGQASWSLTVCHALRPCPREGGWGHPKGSGRQLSTASPCLSVLV